MATPMEDGAREIAREAATAQLQLLRIHVEGEICAPALIMVTSANPGDGKSLTAFSLAECLARSDRRTALLDASRSAPPVDVLRGAASEHVRAGLPTLVRLPATKGGAGFGAVATFVQNLRETFDYTIIDTAPLLADDLAMRLAGCVDGVLVTVRVGRPATKKDELTARLVEQSNGRIIGVVATTAAAVAEFNARHGGTHAASQRRPGVVHRGLAFVQPLQQALAGMTVRKR